MSSMVFLIVERRLQIYIAKDILLQLDFESLVNAEQVSQAWKSIFEGCKLWERIHNSNVTTNQYFTPTNSMNRRLFLLNLQSLEKPEWKKMHETLVMRKSFGAKPEDSASLEEQNDWHREKCLLIHKTLQVPTQWDTKLLKKRLKYKL